MSTKVIYFNNVLNSKEEAEFINELPYGVNVTVVRADTGKIEKFYNCSEVHFNCCTNYVAFESDYHNSGNCVPMAKYTSIEVVAASKTEHDFHV